MSFLWIAFQIDDRFGPFFNAAIRGTLKYRPRELDETYARIIGKIRRTVDIYISTNVFPWIASAERPLQLDESPKAVVVRRYDQL